jgi:hypothetical protein
MRFFIGAEEKEVTAKFMGNPEQHYAWCLEIAGQALAKASNQSIVNNFISNMNKNPNTKVLIDSAIDSIDAFLPICSSCDKDVVFNFLTGLCVPKKGYLSAVKNV